MFVRYFVEIPLPAARVETLLGLAGAWLPGAVAGAERHGQALLDRVGMGAVRPARERPVEVEVGRAVRFPSKLALPISWRPADGAGLLPALDAEIEVATLGPGETQLSINGRYTPPLWLVGTTDRLLLHRVAEATCKHFLDEVAGRMLAGRNNGLAAWCERSGEAQGSNGGARPDW